MLPPLRSDTSFEEVQRPPNDNYETSKLEEIELSTHKRTDSRSSVRARSLSTASVPHSLEGNEAIIKSNHLIRSSQDTVRSDWDSTMRGIMSTFAQFGSFDPSNLENTLFTTPLKKRPPILDRTHSDQSPSTSQNHHAIELSRRSSLPHKVDSSTTAAETSNRAASLDVSTNHAARQMQRTPQRQGQRALPTRTPFPNVFSDTIPTSPAMKHRR